MRIPLKILLGSLLLVLLVATGTKVVALRRSAAAPPAQTAPPVVVRKSPTAPLPLKTVRPVVAVGPHPPTSAKLVPAPGATP